MLSAELSLEKDAEKFARYVGEPSRGRVTIGNTRAQHAGHGASLTGTQQKADSQRWPARAQWDRQGRVEAVEQPLPGGLTSVLTARSRIRRQGSGSPA